MGRERHANGGMAALRVAEPFVRFPVQSISVMTFCIGIKVHQGILALADTKIVKGEEQIRRGKLSSTQLDGHTWWVMTSGLRSVRDKTLTYLEHEIAEQDLRFNYLFEVANRFGNQLRRVRQEDGPSLASSNLPFNMHAIIGGKMPGDMTPKMFYIYPEGNWIESSDDSPYFIIGRTHYAKPMLDRLLTVDMPLRQSLAVAFLAFEATMASVTDVGYPIDVITCEAQTGNTRLRRFSESELESISQWWYQTLAGALRGFPFNQFDPLFDFYNRGNF